MVKRFLIAIALLSLLFGGVIGFKLYKQNAIRTYLAERGEPAVYLNATVAQEERWDQRLQSIGNLRARRGIDIRSEVDAVIRRVLVESGQRVQAGELLVELDDTIDRAVLKSARVRLERARRDFERDKALFERSLISEDEFENSRSEYQSAEALVEETLGIIERKSIHAPFDGTVGIHTLAEGHYLSRGDQLLSLQALGQLYLDFQLPENELERLRPGQRVQFSVPSHPGRVFEAGLRFIDVQIRATTHNILLRAQVDNPGGELLPGMFARVTVILDEAQQVVTLPREAVAFSLYGETVYLLQADEEDGSGEPAWVARRHAVTTGEFRDGRVAVEGLDAGQVVALDSQNRLFEKTPVVIVNRASLAPGASAE